MTPNSSRKPILRQLVVAFTLLVTVSTAVAEMRPTLNFYGAPGLIETPSAEALPDGYLGFSSAHFGPVSKTTLSFQFAPRFSGSFRYTATRNWNDLFCPPDCFGDNAYPIYFDRGFDVRFLALREGRYLPSVTIGFQDFVGTGLQSGEFIVATKHVGENVKLTAGLGWGRLATSGSIGTLFGERPPVVIGKGGKFNISQWFKGEVAPFGGVEWQINDKWGVKAEYSSDGYLIESGEREAFDRRSPFNFGVEYQRNPNLRLGAYYLYGSEIGIAAHLIINPSQRPAGGMGGTAPEPVLPRPPRAADPEFWSPEWVSQPGVQALLTENLGKHLERSGVVVEALGYTGDTAQVRFRNTIFDAESQAVGRVARAMTHVMPASVETFEIVPMVNGVAASKVTVKRTDVESLEFAPDGAALMRDRVVFDDAGKRIEGLAYNPDVYPRFTWSITPYARLRLFDLDTPVKGDLGLRAAGTYEVSSNLSFSASVTKKLVGNLNDLPSTIGTELQPVRSDVARYDALGDPALESLTAAWNTRLGPNLYGRLTVGYLERMFGGVSAEVLWKPVNRRWALGVEIDQVMQRDPDQGLGFGYYDYAVTSGHVSAYYDLGKDYHAQLDVGRYLAGDDGATLTVSREFENGWKAGVFMTLTNVSAEDFGAGSFDKGVQLEIPFSWFTGRPSRLTRPFTLRPFGRDGGARLEVEGRLYESLRGYHASGLDDQWGRFWK